MEIMARINKICSHDLWLSEMASINALEESRLFCKHGLTHLIDVARLAYIENLELGLGISKELIYAAALLHDIGRGREYADGTPHHEAGAEIASVILADCGFTCDEKAEIIKAITDHRTGSSLDDSRQNLAALIRKADKKSRLCLFCSAKAECNWSDEKKNLLLKV